MGHNHGMRRGLLIGCAAASVSIAFCACGRSGFDERGVPLAVSVGPAVRGAIVDWEPGFRTSVRWYLGTSEVGAAIGATPPLTVEDLEPGTVYSFAVSTLPPLSTVPFSQPLLSPFPVWAIDGTAQNADMGYSFDPLGDLDGDGDVEFLVGIGGLSAMRLYEGGESPVLAQEWFGPAGSGFGRWSGLADVDDDGRVDIVTGAHALTTTAGGGTGGVYVFPGQGGGSFAQAPSQTLNGLTPGEHFGVHVATAGDVDGDGHGDVLLSSHLFSGTQASEGIVRLFRGGPSGIADPVWSWQADVDGSQTGVNSGGMVGDVDGDGIDDLAVGAHGYGNGQQAEGRALVFKGGNPPATAPLWSFESDQQNAVLGLSIEGADLNGDGYSDVVTGAFGWDDGGSGDAGRLDVFAGGPAGPSLTPSRTIFGPESTAFFGVSVTVVGDVSGDGLPDIATGAYGENRPGGPNDTGAVYLFTGTASTVCIDQAPAWKWVAEQGGAQAGIRVQGAGDVNGDGVPDLLVGANTWDTQSAQNAGRALLFLGGEPRRGPLAWIGALAVSTARVATAVEARIDDLPGGTYRCTWEWDDGSGPQVVDPCGDLTIVAHTYAGDGTFRPRLRVDAYDGRASEAIGFALVATSAATPAALLRAPPAP